MLSQFIAEIVLAFHFRTTVKLHLLHTSNYYSIFRKYTNDALEGKNSKLKQHFIKRKLTVQKESLLKNQTPGIIASSFLYRIKTQ